MEPRLEANRANWNDRVGIHTRSRFYDVEGWLHDAPGPRPEESEAIGNVDGKTLVHLQCHFGMDTLSWARAGAVVTGVDFSPRAIDEALALSERAGLADRSTFVCANVYDAARVLAGQRLDIVYVSLGALCWLPDVAAWAGVVAELLKPGGQFYIHDVHPFSGCFDEEGERIVYSYFEEIDRPFVFDGEYTYTDGDKLTSTRTYEWNHSLGEIVTALLDRGLMLDALTEHDWTMSRQFPWLEEDSSGRFVVPQDRPRVPLSFTLVARSPSTT